MWLILWDKFSHVHIIIIIIISYTCSYIILGKKNMTLVMNN